MKALTITILSLTLILIGFVQVQSKSMDKNMDKTGAMATPQPMQHDDMKMKPDGMMKGEDMNMQKEEKTMRQITTPSDEELRSRLTPLQYKVTRENGTEPPFNNSYWDNHEPGIYVDIISGKPLFSSTDK